MPNDAIYLISDSGELRCIEHQMYANANIPQELVAKHPNIFAGDQIVGNRTTDGLNLT